MAQDADEQAVALVQKGDRAAFELLVERHQDRVFSVLIRITGDHEAARELAQDTFLRAFKGIHRFKGRALFSTWLVRVAINVGRSHLTSRRHRDARQTIYVGLRPESLAEREAAPPEIDPILLRQAIARLPDRYQEVVLMCALAGVTYEEAAVELAVPRGTVCSRMNTALSLLRKILD